MSAAEDDTELRDLLIHNLDSTGVLSRLKAELRAAVFLAMEEQDRVENKTPLINQNLKNCLSTEDGRLVASLIVDFLQVFHLDFTLAVFQPEINSLTGLDRRDEVCKNLGLSETALNQNTPVLLELVRRGRCGPGNLDLQDTNGGHTPKDKVSPPPFSKIPRYRGQEVRRQGQKQVKEAVSESLQPQVCSDRVPPPGLEREDLDLDLEVEEDLDDGDSFFDDPLPKPQKTYGWKPEPSGSRESPAGSAGETAPSTGGGGRAGGHGRNDRRYRGGPAGAGAGPGEVRELKSQKDKPASSCLDDDVQYDDDFNSHGSELQSSFSIGEEIEEVSIEGAESEKLEESTQDVSVSQLSLSHGADYMEEVT